MGSDSTTNPAATPGSVPSGSSRKSAGGASQTSAAGDSMPFYRILEEEYESLHPDDLLNAGDSSDADRWKFTVSQILDPQDMARRLNDPQLDKLEGLPTANADEDMAVIVLGSDVSLLHALRDYISANRPYTGPTADAFKTALVSRLNTMLANDKLRQSPTVLALPVNAYVAELRKKTDLGAQTAEANRLFLETAFPTQLQRVRDLRLSGIYAKIRDRWHTALCLSGGGIRSATFALGFVQGLARAGVLVDFDYISTVSGGGYLGGWLSSWMQHAGPEYVQYQLSKSPTAKLDPEPVPVKHLRAYANFLSPKLGVLSADTWTLVATYLRNVLLNWLVIIPLIAVVVLIPWAGDAVVSSADFDWWDWLAQPVWDGVRPIIALLYGFGFLAGVIAVAYVHRDEPATAQDIAGKPRRRRKEQSKFLKWCLVPLVLSGIFLTTGWALSWKWDLQPIDESTHVHLIFFTATGALLHLVGWAVSLRSTSRNRLTRAIAISISGALIGALAYVMARHVTAATPELYTTLAMPAFLLLLLIGGQLYLGISSRWTDDADREWGARFNAWIFIVIVVWAAGSAIILFGPMLMLQGYRAVTTIGVGTLSGIVTLLVGSSSRTQGKSEPTSKKPAMSSSIASKVAKLALALAAPVFAVSIIIAVSALDVWLLNLSCNMRQLCEPYFGSLDIADAPGQPFPLTVGVLMLVLWYAGRGFGWLIDTNDFSLNAMYRARLIRAYMGASRPAGERNPDAFTGFDKDDDILMKDLWPAAGSREYGSERSKAKSDAEQQQRDNEHQPLHVVNITLNLVAGENLAWQERKAESFTVTALHAGSAYLGYRRTSPKVRVPGVKSTDIDDTLFSGGQLTLGTAVTISGAAASPNMGYHSSSVIAFLMTLFNARLGAWFGNPGPAGAESFNLAHPRQAIEPIIAELFALTNDRSKYVYLSDGGHFENLGLYEMVLRRCRCIVVSDASADVGCSFEDLGNAIRKIRIDLGVPIEFEDGLNIYPRSATAPEGAKHFAIGKIRYSCVDKHAKHDGTPARPDSDFDGVLIYAKASFYGRDEPRDVYNYAQSSAQFPHESTADQWFSESQFESYRALGGHIATQLCATEEFVSVMNGP